MNLSFFFPRLHFFLHRVVLTLLRRQLSTCECEWLWLSEEALQGQLHFVWPATPLRGPFVWPANFESTTKRDKVNN